MRQDAGRFSGADPVMGGCLKTAYPQRSRCATIRWATIAAVNWSLSWTRFRPLFRSAKATDPAMSLGSARVSFGSRSGMANHAMPGRTDQERIARSVGHLVESLDLFDDFGDLSI
jgi:hypothetical protein